MPAELYQRMVDALSVGSGQMVELTDAQRKANDGCSHLVG